jgi:septal ring-binding cell division protein DamX
VGRGVRAERGTIADATPVVSSAETTPQPPAAAAAPAPTPAGSDPTKAAPPPAAEDLSYFNRLEKPAPVVEKLKPAPETPVGLAAKTAPPPPQQALPPAPPQDEARSTSQASGDPAGSGFAVQIAALNVRSEAEAIARRLSSKGYAAYVLSPTNGTPTVYRVRVGKFSTRREAETVAGKLQKEEQFKPWVTR